MAVDPALLTRIRALHPNVKLQREGGEPFFSSIRELARLQAGDLQRTAALVQWIIPAAEVDHGNGEVLLWSDDQDALPLARLSLHSLPIKDASEIRLVGSRWLQFGDGPLLSLVDLRSIEHLHQHGWGSLVLGLSLEAIKPALAGYLEKGLVGFRDAFRQSGRRFERSRRWPSLPQFIRSIDLYPSVVEDVRMSGFKYRDSWEATLLFRVNPLDSSEQPVIIELGAWGPSGGVEATEVEIFLWDVRREKPEDRPEPRELVVSARSNR